MAADRRGGDEGGRRALPRRRAGVFPAALVVTVSAAVGAVAGVGLAPGAATGQSGDTARDTTPVVPHPELVVRALRTPAMAASLPYAVTVRRVPGEAPGPGTSLSDALRAVPGLQLHDRHNDALGDRIVVRGFGARAQFGVRGVQVLVDGVPATMPDGQATLSHVDVGWVERAEVLRGPAAAAYGNAAGGVILLSTTAPPRARLRQDVAGVAGGQGLWRLRSSTGSGDGTVGWVASVSREWREGYRPHADADRSHATGRLDAPLAGGHLRVVAHAVAYDAANPGALTAEQLAEDPFQAQPINVARATGETGRHGQAGVTWERRLGGAVGGAVLEAGAFALGRWLDNPIPPAIIDLERRAGGARVLVRGGPVGPGGGIAWAGGVDAAAQRDDRRNHANDDGARGPLTLDQAEGVTNVAVHGQALVPVTGRLGLFLGARYDRVAFSATDRLVTSGDPDDSGRRVMDAVSPTAGLRLGVGSDASVFANVSTAFETPTTTELVNRPDGAGGFNPELEPQRTVSWEVGARAGLGAGLYAQGSVYRARVRDALVPFEVESAPGRQYYRNAGGAVHQGVELVAELRRRRLDVLAAYARTDATFSDYATAEARFDGLALPGVRPWTVELRTTARPGAGVTVRLDYERVGAMAVNDGNDAWAAGHGLVALRVSRGFSVGAGEVVLHGGVENLLDRRYVTSVVPNAFGGRYYEPGPGRTVFVGLRAGLAAGER